MSKKITIYYLILLVIVGFKLVGTIYQGSLLVFHSRSSHKLAQQKNQLVNQKLSLKTELSQKQSLTEISKLTKLESYQVVSSPIMVDGAKTVASKNF